MNKQLALSETEIQTVLLSLQMHSKKSPTAKKVFEEISLQSGVEI